MIAGSLESTWQFAGDFLISRDVPANSDVIVVLGGDFWGPRVDLAADLLTKGFAPLMMISGPLYRDRPEGELAIDRLLQRGYSRKGLEVFQHTSESTPGEVIALCKELRRRSFGRVLLVTDEYHSRRSKLTFQIICPGLVLDSIPAANQYRSYEWWKRPADRKTVTTEWRNMLGTIVLAPVFWWQMFF